uniref:Phospholipid/glycerol acyltransferase domain-containing protein n=1 Tax=Parascaris univalens TaxID=6257 RepID=A0A914ZLB7_PARUN
SRFLRPIYPRLHEPVMNFNAEHLLIFVSAVLFPPITFIVLVVIVLATFGKSFGLRRQYVGCLIRIFEWGARQINTTAKRRSRDNLDACNDDDDFVDGQHSSDVDGSTTMHISRLLGRYTSSTNIIFREATVGMDECHGSEQLVSSRGWAVIRDTLHFIKAGIEAIIEDGVTSRFEAEQLASWNMLMRTSPSFKEFVNWKLTCFWVAGFIFRYAVMLPFRLLLFSVGLIFLIVSTAVIGLLPNGPLKRRLNENCMLCCHRILARSVSAVVYFYNEENKAQSTGICVANHTSPIDVMILGMDNVYALIGQRQPGLLGVMQRALSRASAHIWFERSEAKDRSLVAAKMREHIDDSNNLPILIFPEGTCINNTSVMMFKKGSFEVGTTIYPIAMKYDSRFGDAFWNSSQQGWFEYLMQMMTSWAIICHVWYLPPMVKLPGEDAMDFANRVKKEIALCGGLVDMDWDGELKRAKVPVAMRAHQQQRYSKRLARYCSFSEGGSVHLNEDGDANRDAPEVGQDSLFFQSEPFDGLERKLNQAEGNEHSILDDGLDGDSEVSSVAISKAASDSSEEEQEEKCEIRQRSQLSYASSVVSSPIH